MAARLQELAALVGSRYDGDAARLWTEATTGQELLKRVQELPGFGAQQKGRLSFDIMNVGNLINRRWGQINEIPFSSGGGARRSIVNFAGVDPQGRYVYDVQTRMDDYTVRQVKGESQWAAQVTLRYEF